MIGVILKEAEVEAAKEFFQLFKTPWEFYRKDKSYEVVISTQTHLYDIDTKILIIYASEHGKWYPNKIITYCSEYRNVTINFDGIKVPIYVKLLTFNCNETPLIKVDETNEVAGIVIHQENKKIFFIGYNLFKEVAFLLTSGQPIENAYIPTLDIHILMLKTWIVNAGIPLVEIPPVPADYDFVTCLTHDVDFVKIYDYMFSRSILGFIYRATLGSFIKLLNGKFSWTQTLQNWKAFLCLPFVYLRIANDFWFQFDKYIEIEKELGATYFFIPFKNYPGDKVKSNKAHYREVRYDIMDMKDILKKLSRLGFEIGVHGIDAWHSEEKGHFELKRISNITGNLCAGIRIHWLLHDNKTFKILEKAGYSYDSTFGYNETIGYKAGTTQVFRPLDVKNLLEIPLNIQDTALFYPKRMGLSDTEAMKLCKEILQNSLLYEGVLTILWHQRSLAPERLWENFYIELLKEIHKFKVWFSTAKNITEWFRRRRSVNFVNIQFTENICKIKLSGVQHDTQPPLMIRVYYPKNMKIRNNLSSKKNINYYNIPLSGEPEITINY